MHESKKTYEELEKDEDCDFLISLLPHLRDVPKRRKFAIRKRLLQGLMEEDMTAVVPCPTSTGSYDHYQSYPKTPSPNATQVSPLFINGLSVRVFIVYIDNTYQFSAVCESILQQ